MLCQNAGDVPAVCFSPDRGPRRRSERGMGRRGVWDAGSGKQLAVLQGHTGALWSVCFSPDGCRVRDGEPGSRRALGCGTRRLRQSAINWPSCKGTCGKLFPCALARTAAMLLRAAGRGTGRRGCGMPPPADSSPCSLGIRAMLPACPSARTAAASQQLEHGTERARLWDAVSGRLISILHAGTRTLLLALLSVLTGAASPRPVRTGRLAPVGRAPPAPPLSLSCSRLRGRVCWLAFSSSGGRIGAASEDGVVRLYDAATGKQIALADGHTGALVAAAFSPDLGRVATASGDNTVRV